MTAFSSLDDLELVERSRAGDRDAFGELVGRYQSLVCSITYSATGSIATSEDLAQETFIAAWRQLGSLREPAKLRAWLCGIARNLSHNLVRRSVREPVNQSASLDAVAEQAAPEALPTEQAVSREEQELLWRAVERIPETYREPLVLYYRERQSVEAVARALELSEDAAKQRLSRGRKLLENELATFVEGALSRTAPGRAFTMGVLASLPAFAMSASAATIGATTVKGSAAAGSASLLMILNTIMGPVIGLLGAYIGVKASIEGTRTPRERAFMVRQAKRVIIATVLFNAGIFGFIYFAMPRLRENPWIYGIIGAAIPIAFTVFLLVSTLRFSKAFMALRDEEQRLHPAAYSEGERVGAVREYRSKARLFGLPLFHFRSGRLAGEPHRPAVGWVAIGDRAYGILFAGGGLAVGGIAMGGVSAGIISIGGATLGFFALGGLAVGGLALGGAAIGAMAMGGVALGFVGAQGGLAIAQQFALGGAVFAQHANDAAAREFFAHWKWLDMTRPEVRNVLTTIGWLPLLLIFVGARKARRKI